MALWGKIDQAAITGTVKLVNGSATVDANTASALNTELKIGNVIFLSTANTAAGANTRYRVDAIANGTSVTIGRTYAGTTNNISAAYIQQPPKYIHTNNQPGQRTNDIIGVDRTEAGIAANRAKGIHTPGWVSYRTYTNSAGATRHKTEVLVAMRSMTAAVAADANDDDTLADS